MNTIGIIGCGSVVQLFYLPVLRTFFESSSKLFFDIDEQAAASVAAQAKGNNVALDILIAQADLIVITTPPESHFSLLKQCILPGKKIFCEKPFLLRGDEAKEIAALAKAQNAEVSAAHVRRFYPAPVLARSFLQSGAGGNIRRVEIFEGGRFNYESSSGYVEKSPLGGVLPDTGAHSLDTMLYAAAWDEADLHFKLTDKKTSGTEPSHIFKAHFEIDMKERIIPASLYLSRRDRLANKVNFYTDKGILEVPLFLENTIRFRSPSGSIAMHGEDYIHSIEEAFIRQFYHLLHEGGALLRAERFINLSSLLETLLKPAAR